MSNPIVDVEVDGETQKRLKLGEMDDGETVPLTLLRRSEIRDGKYGPYVLAQFRHREEDETYTLLVSSSYNAPGFVNEDEPPTEFDQACVEDLGEAMSRDEYTSDEGSGRGKNVLDCLFEAPLDDDGTVLKCYENVAESSGRTYRTYWFGKSDGDGGIKWRDGEDETEAEATTEA